jgi:hypothetical protein
LIDGELESVARQSADESSGRLDELRGARVEFLTVATTSPLQVRWRGANVLVSAKDKSYFPVVGDRVLCLHGDDHQLVIICALDGQP